MKRLAMIGALCATLFSFTVSAQPGSGMGSGMGNAMGDGAGPGTTQSGKPGKPRMRDCSQAPDPAACTARREARKQAMETCKGKPAGTERRQCMQQQMPPPDCTKAANPQRCEQHQKAREACKDKVGPEHRNCLREQFKAQ